MKNRLNNVALKEKPSKALFMELYPPVNISSSNKQLRLYPTRTKILPAIDFPSVFQSRTYFILFTRLYAIGHFCFPINSNSNANSNALDDQFGHHLPNQFLSVQQKLRRKLIISMILVSVKNSHLDRSLHS